MFAPLPTTNQTTLSNSGPSSTYNDEVGSDQVSVQRRRRTRAELNLSYPCTVCDEKYASSQSVPLST